MTGCFLPPRRGGAEGRRVLDDRIEIESLGILLSGLTIEEMKQGTSRIRNHVIARVFRELHLIEQWGTGVRRIFEEAKALGLPEPKIEEVGMRVRFTIYLAKLHKIDSIAKVESEPTQSGVQSGVQSEMAQHVLRLLAEKPMSKSEIAHALGKEKRTRYLSELMKKLIEEGLVEYTIPDKLNSRLQKYRLVETKQ